jgi:hypothetical protein
MGNWRPDGLRKNEGTKSNAEEVWDSWLSEMRCTVELGLGFAHTRKPRPPGRDAQLARLLGQRNAVRRKRDEQKEGAKRAVLQDELRELQKKVKYRLGVCRGQVINSRNKALLNCKSKNPSVYWDLLKRTVGVKRKKMQIPGEVLFDGVVTCGDKIREVWGEAFRRIFAVDKEEKAFREDWLEETRQEVGLEVKLSHQFDSLNVELNQPISEDEVMKVIAILKQGKAAGVDAMVNEILMFGGEGIGKATANLCQFMFSCEKVPKDWARGLIFPLYKDGDVRNPDNYRGITLLSVVGKVYASVLNARVMKWCEKNGVLSEEQAGFRPGRSTVDHIFSVAEVLRLRRGQKKETHCAFLDIKKAYDTIHRDGLWKRLLDVGIRGKLWRVLKNLYEVVESCVLVGKQRSEWFEVEAGVRQGCILSPILFAIWIDGLARALQKTKVKSILQNIKFNFTFFADDLAVLAESRNDLQKLLDTAFSYSECWRFKWNCAKSKVMRFGPDKGKKKELYFLGLQELEIVEVFKFLGVDLQQSLSWTTTKLRFAKKARSRLPMIKKATFEGLSVDSGEKLWETLIRPTLEYAAEVWGGDDWPDADKIQNAAGRTLLGLYRSTAVEVARGELGWLSLRARRDIKQLRYWGKLVKMEDSRLVKQIYRYCKDRTNAQKGSFCHSVQKLLAKLDLGHLWRTEQIGELKDWTSLVMASVKQSDQDLWSAEVQKKRKLRTYSLIKTDLCREEYLSWEITGKQRLLYAQLRSGSHQLRIERGRWEDLEEAKRVCKVCGTGKIEDEKHFLLDCFVFERFRRNMFHRIMQETGYDMMGMKDESNWLLQVLIGDGLPLKESRLSVGKAVAAYLAVAMRKRARILQTEQSYVATGFATSRG